MGNLLVEQFQQGGYTLYVRHGEANVGADQPGFSFEDCSTQRNLSRNGQYQAGRFGNAIRRLNIPVETPVIASPFCRAKESACLPSELKILASILSGTTFITPITLREVCHSNTSFWSSRTADTPWSKPVHHRP
ncbi:hypothetical protein ACQ4XT_05900 [Halobacillus faecis]